MKKVSDEKIIEMLLVHGNVNAAATVLGISRNSIYRRMKQPDFQKRLTSEKSAILTAVTASLIESLTDAVKGLKQVINEADAAAGVKVSASDALLRHSLRYMEALDFETRLKALEEAQTALQHER